MKLCLNKQLSSRISIVIRSVGNNSTYNNRCAIDNDLDVGIPFYIDVNSRIQANRIQVKDTALRCIRTYNDIKWCCASRLLKQACGKINAPCRWLGGVSFKLNTLQAGDIDRVCCTDICITINNKSILGRSIPES